jgi:hypothetical protein
MTPFLGVLAGKQGFGGIKKTLYFALLRVLVDLYFCKLLLINPFRKVYAPKKNRA